MLRLFVASDMHFEFLRDQALPPLPDAGDFDVLVLAGDIGELPDAFMGIDRLLAMFPATPLIYVAGNHEFFGRHYWDTLKVLRESYQGHAQVNFLETDALELHGYTFLGCTLWSGLNGLGPEVEAEMIGNGSALIRDFSMIGYEDGDAPTGIRPFHPRDMQSLHWQSVRWLEAQLKILDRKKTIVVTHFPPTMEARHAGIAVDTPSVYFQADCESLVHRYQPALWLYGHNHYSREDRYGETRLFSNQLGYPGEGTGFSKEKIILLP
jgi:hypothetical protein